LIRRATISPLLQAVAIMSAGKFLFAIQDVIIKEMSAGYPVHQIMTIRGLVAVPLLLILIHFTSGLKIFGSGIYVLRREAKVEPRPIAYTGLTRR
jgi:hypothetical protein